MQQKRCWCFLLLALPFLAASELSTCTAATDTNCTQDPNAVASSLMQSRSHALKQAHALGMQSSLVSQRDFNFMHLNPQQVEKRIATLVTNHVEKGEHMSELDIGILEEVIIMLKEKVIPSLMQTHATEEGNIKLKHNDIVECIEEQRELEETQMKHSEELKMAQAEEYDSCLDTDEKLEAEKKDFCGSFQDYVDELGNRAEPKKHPTCAFPPARGTNLRMWLTENSRYYNKSTPQYVQKDDICKDKIQECATQKIKCKAELHISDTYACDYCDDIEFVNAEYRTCYADALLEYGVTKADCKVAVAARKIELAAIEKAECYLRLLMSRNDTEQMLMLEKCKILMPDTSRLDIEYPEPPKSIKLKFNECPDTYMEEKDCVNMEAGMRLRHGASKNWWKDGDTWKVLTTQPTPFPTPYSPPPPPIPVMRSYSLMWAPFSHTAGYEITDLIEAEIGTGNIKGLLSMVATRSQVKCGPIGTGTSCKTYVATMVFESRTSLDAWGEYLKLNWLNRLNKVLSSDPYSYDDFEETTKGLRYVVGEPRADGNAYMQQFSFQFKRRIIVRTFHLASRRTLCRVS